MSEQGTALRRLREDQGLTQVELAVRLNVSRFTVGDWEKGKVAWPEKREQYILEACGIGRDRFFQDIAEGVSYEVARQGGGDPPRPKVARIAETGHALDAKLRRVMDIRARDYSAPHEVLRIQADVWARISVLLERAYRDIGINEEGAEGGGAEIDTRTIAE